jgi:hypothetical protein
MKRQQWEDALIEQYDALIRRWAVAVSIAARVQRQLTFLKVRASRVGPAESALTHGLRRRRERIARLTSASPRPRLCCSAPWAGTTTARC